MKKPRKRNNRAAMIATLLLLIALPISVLGTQTVNDIRNRAGEEEPDLYFITDFTSDEIANAHVGIPYEHKIITGSASSEDSLLALGCDTSLCGDKCPETTPPTPEGLFLRSTTNTLIWQNPQNDEIPETWDITISARTQKDDGSYDCAVETFPLTLSSKEDNDPPQCKVLFTRKKLDNIPQSYKTDFILMGTDMDDGISDATFSIIKDGVAEEVQNWTFDKMNNVIINKDSDPQLSFTLDETGSYSIRAEMTDSTGQRSECAEEEGKGLFIVIPGDNGSPEFTSDPYEDSTPGTSLLTGQQYSYTVEAEDPNGDDIDYFIINETGWLSFTVNKNEDGEFEGTFSGTPDQPGSYTAVIALNDGYHDHYSTQIWVINVDSPTNDTPVVNIVQPEAGSSAGNNETVLIRWEATDSNLIERFDVFLATDPANESTLQPIAIDIGYNYDSYIWDTGPTAPGRYYIVVRATDNQSPPATGQGISSIFTITNDATPIPPDDAGPDDDDSDIPESYPQIKNLRPSDRSKIKDTKPLVSADIFASNDNTIKKGSTEVKIDSKDITEKIDIRGEGKKEGSILYTPEEPLTEGSHQITVSFRDSSDKIARKTWTFTIETEKPDEPDDSDDDIISILGFKVPKRIALIFSIGLLLLVLAVAIPWLFYAAWRRSSDDDDIDFYISPEYPSDPKDPDPPEPPMPIQQTSIVPTIVKPEIDEGRHAIQKSREEFVSTDTSEKLPEPQEIPSTKVDMDPGTEIPIVPKAPSIEKAAPTKKEDSTDPTPDLPTLSPGESHEPETSHKPESHESAKPSKKEKSRQSDEPYKPVSDNNVIQAFQAISSDTAPDRSKKSEPKLKPEANAPNKGEPGPLKPDLSPSSLTQDSEQSPQESPTTNLPPTVPPIAP